MHHYQKHTRSRLYHQGQRSQEQNVIPPCTEPTWVVHRHILGVNSMGTAESIRITKSRSWKQGQRSQDQIPRAVHIYPSWVVNTHKLATLASIP